MKEKRNIYISGINKIKSLKKEVIMEKNVLLSRIPKVDEILNCEDIIETLAVLPRILVVETVREVLDRVRKHILEDDGQKINDLDIVTIAREVRKEALEKNKRHLKKVINCTGIIIHTNLGRSILCREAVDAVVDVAGSYSNLEYNLENGERGSRYSHVEYIITRITGAEAAMVVNNNAAAVLVTLSSLCRGKEAIVSRGELVEIGGSFRIPEVMEMSGAILKEVGSTNRTHLYDYENAIDQNTGVLLKVHTSNYRILGFTESVAESEIAALGERKSIPTVEDIGSGSFVDLSRYGLSYEPTVQDALRAGIDLVTFSGDKMLGGPQAGIIAGKREYIELIKRNPLTRALRIDKMTLAALEATLKKYLDMETAAKDIPTLRMITETAASIKDRTENLMKMLKSIIGDKAEICMIEGYSQVGGGSMPLEDLSTFAVSIKPYGMSVNRLEKELRYADPPVIARTQKDALILDARTLTDDEIKVMCEVLAEIFEG